jgi:IS30 family transposase
VKPSSYKPFAKLTPAEVVVIRESSATRPKAELAAALRVHRSTISRAARRRTWRDVP